MGKSIFDGRVQIKYSYGCYGMTRGRRKDMARRHGHRGRRQRHYPHAVL